MVQSVKRLTSAQVRALMVCGFENHIGLCANSSEAEPASDSVCVCLSLYPSPTRGLSLFLSLKINK